MAARTLRINEIGVETVDSGRFKSKSLLRRFREHIENSDWDDRLEDHLKRVNKIFLIGAAAGLIFILSVGVRILF